MGLEVGGAWKTEPTRRPVPLRVKRIVYERAKGRCQKCKTPLKMGEGDFHHKGKPTSIRPSSIVFLCLKCHRKYGLEYRTIKRETIWGVEKERRVIRKRVVRKKPKKYRRIAIRNLFGNVIGYRTVKIRKSGKKKRIREKAPIDRLTIVKKY